MTSIREDLDSDSARGLHLLAKRLVSEQAGDAAPHVVLLVDQFEELFTQTTDETERRQFIDLLVNAVSEPHGPTIVILTLRADFYDRPMQYPALGKLVEACSKSVLPMDLEDLRAVIEKPAALPDVRLTFDEGLVGDLLYEVRGEPAPLPLLQFTLSQLFERRNGHRLTRTAYQEIDGVRGALAKHAEATYKDLPSEEHRRLTRALFLRLIEPGVTEQDTTRRRIVRSELKLDDPRQTLIIQQCAEAFTAARLLIADQKTIEVSHEALIRKWTRLREWLNEARDDITLQHTISHDAAEWLKNGKSTGDLYRGRKLAEAREWSKRDVPSADELAFVQASTDAEHHQRRRRQRVVVGAFLVLLAFIVGLLAAFLDARQNAQIAGEARIAADRRALETFSLLLASHAQNAVNENNIDLGIALALQANSIENPPIQAFQALENAAFSPGTRYRLVGHKSEVWSFAFSPDGQYIASASSDRSIDLWELGTGNLVRSLIGHEASVRAVAFSQDGETLVSAGEDGSIILWSLQTGEMADRFHPLNHAIRNLLLLADGSSALVAYSDGTLLSFDLTQGIVQRQAQPIVDSAIWSVSLTPDGQMALLAVNDGSLLLWDMSTFQLAGHLGEPSNQILSATLSPDGRMALSGSDDGMVRLWDVTKRSLVQVFEGHNAYAWVWSVAFSSDGTRAVSGASDRKVLLWDVESGQVVSQFLGHESEVAHVSFAPRDDTTLVSSSYDATIRIWDTQSARQPFSSRQHAGAVRSIAVTPNGEIAVSSADDGQLVLWDLMNLVPIGKFGDYRVPILAVAVSSDNRTALAAGGTVDYSVLVWDIANQTEVRRLTGHTNWVTSLAISPDGKMAASGSHDGLIILWDLSTGTEIRRLAGHRRWVMTVAFAPDGRTVISGGFDATVRLWDVASGRQLDTLAGHADWVSEVIFSHDGKSAVSGSNDGTAIVWDLESGTKQWTLNGHTGAVTSVALSPDGTTVATGSMDGEIILWDIRSGQQVDQIQESSAVYSLAFFRNGRAILSGKENGTITEWAHLVPAELREWLTTHRYVRALTEAEERQFDAVQP